MKKSLIKTVAAAVAGILALPLMTGLPVSAAEETLITINESMLEPSGDITAVLQNALNEAQRKASADNRYVIEVKTDSPQIYINKPLRIYSYTTLDLTGRTIMLKGGTKTHMLTFGVPSQNSYKGYDEFRDIKLIGGVWDGNGAYYRDSVLAKMGSPASSDITGTNLIQGAHVTGFSMQGVTLKNVYNNHLMEIAAAKDVTINNCTFADMVLPPAKYSKPEYDLCREALQIDVCNSKFGDYYTSGDAVLGCHNVTVSNSSFRNVIRGVGTHRVSDDGFTNLTISGNVFENINDKNLKGSTGYTCYGISLYSAKDSVIRDNTFNNCKEAGVVIWDDCSGTEIKGVNTVNGDCRYGILVRDGILKSITGVSVKGTKESAIYVSGASVRDADESDRIKDVNESYVADISSNKIANCGKSGIMVDSSSKIGNIEKNNIKNTSACGIGLWGAEVKTVSNNMIILTKSGKDGIYVSGSEVGDINSNTVRKAGGIGITADKKSFIKNISFNKIIKSKDSGIIIRKGSTVNTVKGNEINKSGSSGFRISTALVKNIEKNKIKYPDGTALLVEKDSVVRLVAGNTFYKYKGLAVSQNESLIGEIRSNRSSAAR